MTASSFCLHFAVECEACMSENNLGGHQNLRALPRRAPAAPPGPSRSSPWGSLERQREGEAHVGAEGTCSEPHGQGQHQRRGPRHRHPKWSLTPRIAMHHLAVPVEQNFDKVPAVFPCQEAGRQVADSGGNPDSAVCAARKASARQRSFPAPLHPCCSPPPLHPTCPCPAASSL